MADGSAGKRKPRIRKAAPSVREQIEESSKQQEAKSEGRQSSIMRPFSALRRLLAKIFRPLAPTGRFLKKVLKWLIPRYFINAWREVRQVTWPTRRETWRLTGAVFVFALVFGAMVAVVDKGLDEIFKKVILKQ